LLPVKNNDEIVMRYRHSFVTPPPVGTDVYSVRAYRLGVGTTTLIGTYHVHSTGISALHIPSLPALTPDCYRFEVFFGANPPIFAFHPVQVITDSCHTSVIEFRGCGNQLGYDYNFVFPGIPMYQRVRIWARLVRNRVESESDVFFGSNGLVQKVYARTRNVFDFESDYMALFQCNALALAAQHDKFYVQDEAYGTKELTVVEAPTYEYPNTPKKYPASAKLTLKVNENAWNCINTYCSTC
jgi:hypothetical protein